MPEGLADRAFFVGVRERLDSGEQVHATRLPAPEPPEKGDRQVEAEACCK